MEKAGSIKVHDFWFTEHGPDDWYSGDAAFDKKIANRFGATHTAISKGEGVIWRGTLQGRVAEIVVLDQFSRQLFRGEARAFAQDGMALVLAQEAVGGGLDKEMTEHERQFTYMPYMHSESLAVHEVAMKLFEPLGERMLGFEKGHYELIRRFGRFPMRNKVLGRESTEEELAYIAEREGKMF